MGYFQRAFVLSTTIFLTLIAYEAAHGAIADGEEKKMIERINRRYDDFFHRQQQQEEQQQERMSGVPALEKKRAEHEKELKKAQQQYVLNHHRKPVDPKLEAQWNEAQKAHAEENRINANRYLDREIDVEKIQKRGRQIPPSIEFDLDN